MPRKLWAQLVAIIAALFVVVFWMQRGLEQTGWLAAPLALFAVVAGPTLAQLFIRQKSSNAEQTAAALHALTQAVSSAPSMWLQQLGLHEKEMADVPWSRPSDPSLIHLPLRSTSGLRGSSEDPEPLVDALLGSTRRLVILGIAGAGKSALALKIAESVIERRRSASSETDLPLPVIFPLAEWSPAAWNGPLQRQRKGRGSNSLERWMVWFIHQRCPEIRGITSYGANAAEQLIKTGRILPVFDGLDEVRAPERRAALSALKDKFDDRLPLIICCRRKEYVRATRALARSERVSTGVIRNAEVVEAASVPFTNAAAWLADETRDSPEWVRMWRPIQLVLTNRDHPVSRALNTPLMLHLARAAYRNGGQPDELLHLPDTIAIRNHLIDAYVPALMGQRSTDSRAQHEARDSVGDRISANHASAERYLQWLAHIHTQPRRAYSLSGALVANAASPLVLRICVYLPILAAFLGMTPWLEVIPRGLGAVAIYPDGSPAMPPSPESQNHAAQQQVQAMLSINYPLCITLCLVGAVILSEVLAGLGYHARAHWRNMPSPHPAWAFVALAPFLLISLSPLLKSSGLDMEWLLGADAARIPVSSEHLGEVVGIGAFVTLLVCGIAYMLPRPVIFVPRGIRNWLWLERGVLLSICTLLAAGAIAVWLYGPQPLDHVTEWRVGPLLTGLACTYALAVAGVGAEWFAFRSAHAEAVLRTRLPLRLDRFLRDMHRIGILRNTGGAYHFRHSEVQLRLAERYRSQ
ncbi:hypothetical protein OG978_32700 [Streptomyces sp. NBC_01591]|uniref:NACHT domain-containing protein n=1 Tax=Streptomyces sp. NBC_01591 TaxID=2975888 RepID=UPI002DD7FA0F|nr:hypothetical protein [Streptomyces sp. NBC_01591]WSD71734.1 hypothetical protein OG978_32700 [Streptomyces sp. NBC_01591]